MEKVRKRLSTQKRSFDTGGPNGGLDAPLCKYRPSTPLAMEHFVHQPQSKPTRFSFSMDRLTQLQDAIDKLALLFVSSLDHLSKNAPLVALNPEVPVVTTGNKHRTAKDKNASFLASQFSHTHPHCSVD